MNLLLLLQLGLQALTRNRMRAALTVLGIVIGVAAVIAIVALGQGSSAQVTSQLAGLGTNVLTVRPGSTRFGGIRAGAGSSLKVEDAIAIQSGIHGIADLSPISEGTTQVIAGNRWRPGRHRLRALQYGPHPAVRRDIPQFDRDPGRAGRRYGPDDDRYHRPDAHAPQDHAGHT